MNSDELKELIDKHPHMQVRTDEFATVDDGFLVEFDNLQFQRKSSKGAMFVIHTPNVKVWLDGDNWMVARCDPFEFDLLSKEEKIKNIDTIFQHMTDSLIQNHQEAITDCQEKMNFHEDYLKHIKSQCQN